MAANDELQLDLPAGSLLCPASGPSVSCSGQDSVVPTEPGMSSLPAGTRACPVRPDKPGPHAPASCNETVLPASQPAEPAGVVGSTFLPAPVTPSVPIWTLSPADQPRVRLTSNASSPKPGQTVVLTATANATVTGTRSAIEIFDQTTTTLAGACMEGSQCLVAYTAKAGVHDFAAYITPPSAGQPAGIVVMSNPVSISWFGIGLVASSAAIVSPGKAVTFTATATADVGSSGYQLGLFDKASGTRLTFCTQGTTCSTNLTKSQAGSRSIVAYLAATSETLPPPEIQATSPAVTATWLGVTLDANTTHPQRGSTIFMRARTNIDMTNTPWSIGIYDQKGDLVSQACKTGTTCSARVPITTGSTPWYTAVVGAARPVVNEQSSTLAQLVRTAQSHASLVNIQARSNPVQPTRLLWGVDSCKPFTSNANASRGLYPQVVRDYGTPDFWGRYLTRTYNCPGISSAEIAAASNKRMGILPIYNDYDCSAVRGYSTGMRYATEASGAAANLGIPAGTALAIDIEPPGDYCPGAANVDAGFIEGWYDGILLANYAPLYYGNGTRGSEFGSAWCRAVKDRPETAVNSYLWSFEPSLLGRFTRARAPEYSPEEPGCAGNLAAWQYVLSSGSRPDVDSDEAISTLPLWFPQAG